MSEDVNDGADLAPMKMSTIALVLVIDALTIAAFLLLPSPACYLALLGLVVALLVLVQDRRIALKRQAEHRAGLDVH